MTKKPLEEQDPFAPKTFTDLLGGGEFYPDLPRIDFKELIDHQVLVVDAQLIEDFTSKFGTHDCLLLMIRMSDLEGNPTDYTTITSGEVVMKRVVKALKEGLLPLLGTIIKTDTYYNIL